MFAKDFCAAWFARQTGKPVKFVYEREEVFISTRQRHPMYITVKTGVKKDGTILAQQFKAHADGGAFNSTAPTMIALSCYFLMVPYRVPNLIYEGHHVYTNKPVGGAMRGHGIPQARFAVERQLDMIAERIGIDPVELRLKNSIQAGEPHPAKFIINSCGFSDCLTKAAEAIGWKEKRGKTPPRERGRPGRGLLPRRGQQHEPHQLRRRGSDWARTAPSMSFPGPPTSVRARKRSSLRSWPRCSAFRWRTSGSPPPTPASHPWTPAPSAAASRCGPEMPPVWPPKRSRGKLFRFVADKLEANPEDLVARDRTIFVKGSPDRGMALKDVIKGYQYADLPMPIVGRAAWFAPSTEPTTLFKEDGNFAPNYSFMTQAAEVEVDLDTGKIKLLKMVTAHDCGRAINPMLVEGQLEGSVVGGMGQALYENIIVEKGQVMNPSFLDYGFPTFMEMPEIETIDIETDDPVGPFGAKEAGEGTQLSPGPGHRQRHL